MQVPSFVPFARIHLIRTASLVRAGFFLCGILMLVPATRAAESLGKIELDDLFVEPRFSYQEQKEGKFELGNSYLAGRWRQDQNISARLALGSLELIGRPARFPEDNPNTLTAIEAFAQAETVYGTFRFGLLPLPFGTEAGVSERDLAFPRSLMMQEHYVGLRDVGFSYSINNEGYFTSWAIHNGESGKDLDGQVWFTTRAGFENREGFRVGLSGQTGRTTPKSTNPKGTLTTGSSASAASAGLQHFDPNLTSKVRIGNLYLGYLRSRFSILGEVTVGETRQDALRIVAVGTHADMSFRILEDTWMQLRYDVFDPERGESLKTQEATIGFSLRKREDTSALSLYGTWQDIPNQQNNLHRVLLVWRLTPLVSSRSLIRND